MNPKIFIRPFRELDRLAVVALWAEAFPDDPPHNISSEMIDVKLRVQPDLFLVAEFDGTVGRLRDGGLRRSPRLAPSPRRPQVRQTPQDR